MTKDSNKLVKFYVLSTDWRTDKWSIGRPDRWSYERTDRRTLSLTEMRGKLSTKTWLQERKKIKIYVPCAYRLVRSQVKTNHDHRFLSERNKAETKRQKTLWILTTLLMYLSFRQISTKRNGNLENCD